MAETNAVTHLPWADFSLRLAELTGAYLRDDYDLVYFLMRGGMTPAHRLAHLLGCASGGEALRPIYLQRHTSDAVQSATVEPVLARPLEPIAPGMRLLVVEDTIGEGKTLLAALAELQRFRPAVLDVVSVGLDHRDWLMKAGIGLADSPLSQAIVGFDYWGWLVFPWENQAAEALNRPAGRLPYRAGELCVRPLDVLDGAHAETADAVLGPGGPGTCVVLTEKNLAEAASVAPGSADWVVVRDLLPSRLELLHWRDLAGMIKLMLRPGGHLVFSYLDRTRIQGPRDIVPHAEYYTASLIDRLMTKVGFARTQYLGSSDRASFARATLPQG
jgi:hypoxanthine phosphoribosyltransferase